MRSSHTIVPRFLAAGGDPKRAMIIGSDHPLVIPDDVDRLERTLRLVSRANPRETHPDARQT